MKTIRLSLCLFFLVLILSVQSYAQTILKHNQLIFSNDGGFVDTMHDESIYTFIPDDVNYLDSLEWLIATGNLVGVGYGTMNLVVRDPGFGQAVPEKHFFAGPFVGGDGAGSGLLYRVNHYKGVGGLDPSLLADIQNDEIKPLFLTTSDKLSDTTLSTFKLKVTLTELEAENTIEALLPFISDITFGTSLYENLMFFNTEYASLSGGASGVSVEVYEALDITLEKTNPKKLGLQMEGGDLIAGSLYVNDEFGKVYMSSGTLNRTTVNTHFDNGQNQPELYVDGDIRVTGKIFGQIGTFDSYVLHPHVGILCFDSTANTNAGGWFYVDSHYTSNDNNYCSNRGSESFTGTVINSFSLNSAGEPQEVSVTFSDKNDLTAETVYSPSVGFGAKTMANIMSDDSNKAYTDIGQTCGGSDYYNVNSGSKIQCPSYMPSEKAMLERSMIINLTNDSLFKGSTGRAQSTHYEFDDTSTNAFIMVQGTIGNITSQSWHNTFCMKTRWMAVLNASNSRYDSQSDLVEDFADSNIETDGGYSAASCKDFHGSNESTATITNMFSIPVDPDFDYQFFLYIYPIAEDQSSTEYNNTFPTFVDFSGLRISIVSLPVNPGNGSAVKTKSGDTITGMYDELARDNIDTGNMIKGANSNIPVFEAMRYR